MDDSTRLVLTLTPNPALDVFLGTRTLEPDVVHRATSELRRAGGKGLNVARVLHMLGLRARAIVPTGGGVGDEVVRRARAEGLDIVPVRVGCDTRINVVVEDAKVRRLKVNMAGGPASPADTRALADAVRDTTEPYAALVIAGALAPGMPIGMLAELVRYVAKRRVAVFIDAEVGIAHVLLGAGAIALKVNRAEFEGILGDKCTDQELPDAMEVVRHRYVLQMVAVTLGPRGAALRDDTGYCIRQTTGGEAKRRLVGAGDAFLAGLVAGWMKNQRGETLLDTALDAAALWADREAFQ